MAGYLHGISRAPFDRQDDHFTLPTLPHSPSGHAASANSAPARHRASLDDHLAGWAGSHPPYAPVDLQSRRLPGSSVSADRYDATTAPRTPHHSPAPSHVHPARRRGLRAECSRVVLTCRPVLRDQRTQDVDDVARAVSRALQGQHHPDRLQQDLQVKGERTILDVV